MTSWYLLFMNIKHFFFWSYWFSQPFIARGALAVTFWVVTVGVLVLGVVLFMLRHYQSDHLKQEVLGRFASLATTGGILSVIWFWFRQQRIPFLSWRFWMVMIVAGILVWLVKIIRYTRERLPAIKAEQAIRERRQRYLPKAKK